VSRGRLGSYPGNEAMDSPAAPEAGSWGMAQANLSATLLLCAWPLLSACVTALLVEDCPPAEGGTGTASRATCFDPPARGGQGGAPGAELLDAGGTTLDSGF
jgi:hypothetical protein